jgi:hypothetical protein
MLVGLFEPMLLGANKRAVSKVFNIEQTPVTFASNMLVRSLLAESLDPPPLLRPTTLEDKDES